MSPRPSLVKGRRRPGRRPAGPTRLPLGTVADVPCPAAGRGVLLIAQVLSELIIQGGHQDRPGQLLQQSVRPSQRQALPLHTAYQLLSRRLLSGRLRLLLPRGHAIQRRGYLGTVGVIGPEPRLQGQSRLHRYSPRGCRLLAASNMPRKQRLCLGANVAGLGKASAASCAAVRARGVAAGLGVEARPAAACSRSAAARAAAACAARCWASRSPATASARPGWLEAFVNVNPLSHVATAARNLMNNTGGTGGAVAWSLTATAVITLVWAPITLRLYSKQG
jgi:hypothetical protein